MDDENMTGEISIPDKIKDTEHKSSDVTKQIASSGMVTGTEPLLGGALTTITELSKQINASAASFQKITEPIAKLAAQNTATIKMIRDSVAVRGLNSSNFSGEIVKVSDTITDSINADSLKEFLDDHQPMKPDSIKDALRCLENLQALLNYQYNFDIMNEARRKDGDVDFTESSKEYQRLLKYIGEQAVIINDYTKREDVMDLDILDGNLKYLLKKAGITEEELEKICNKGSAYYRRALNKNDPKRRMSVDSLVQLSELFKVSLDRLVFEDMRKEMTPSIKKTLDFIDSVIRAIKLYKMKWIREEREESEKQKLLDGKVDLRDDPLANLYIISEPGVIKKELEYEVWRSRKQYGDAYLILFSKEGEVIKYKFVNCDEDYQNGDQWQLIFDTAEDGSGVIRKRCDQFYEILNEYENVFVLSKEAGEAMDSFFVGIDEEGGE